MAGTRELIAAMYAAFNARDVDGALAGMTEDVSWPKASDGGRVEGKEAIRGYWTRQWGEFDPHVEPVGMTEEDGGRRVRVQVHQVVKSVKREQLFDGEVEQVYTLWDGLIARMDLGNEGAGPTGAFSRVRPC